MARRQNIVTVEEDGKVFYLNLTEMRKLKGAESAALFRREGEAYIFDHWRRVSLLRKEGYV